MNNKILNLYENDADTFKHILRQVKKKHGKLPQISKILLELFVYVSDKR